MELKLWDAFFKEILQILQKLWTALFRVLGCSSVWGHSATHTMWLIMSPTHDPNRILILSTANRPLGFYEILGLWETTNELLEWNYATFDLRTSQNSTDYWNQRMAGLVELSYLLVKLPYLLNGYRCGQGCSLMGREPTAFLRNHQNIRKLSGIKTMQFAIVISSKKLIVGELLLVSYCWWWVISKLKASYRWPCKSPGANRVRANKLQIVYVNKPLFGLKILAHHAWIKTTSNSSLKAHNLQLLWPWAPLSEPIKVGCYSCPIGQRSLKL